MKRTNKQNIISKKNIFDLLGLEKKNILQHEKYQVISLTAKRSLKMQKGLFNELRDFDLRCNDMYEEEVETKKYRFNELEYNVFKIKSNTLEIEKTIAHIKDKISEKLESVKNLKKKNIKIKENIYTIRKKYLKTQIKLFNIYRSLKVKSLEDIINKFKDERIQYQGYYSLVRYNFNYSFLI